MKDDGFSEPDAARIENIIKQALGQAVRVHFEFPDRIPQLKSGKFRNAYSELSESHPEKMDLH